MLAFPQAIRRKIEGDAHLQSQCASFDEQDGSRQDQLTVGE